MHECFCQGFKANANLATRFGCPFFLSGGSSHSIPTDFSAADSIQAQTFPSVSDRFKKRNDPSYNSFAPSSQPSPTVCANAQGLISKINFPSHFEY